MVLALTATLAGSCLGLFLLLFIKHWELSRRRVLLSGLRRAAEHAVRAALFTLHYRITGLLRGLWRLGASYTRGAIHEMIARLLLVLENMLERSLHFLRHTLSPSSTQAGQASLFLQEVAAHKKRLMRNLPMRTAAKTVPRGRRGLQSAAE